MAPADCHGAAWPLNAHDMRSAKRFTIGLAAFVALHLCYGLKRFTLGVDFTDEGAYISWPMRMLFGEKLFVSEPATLLRPLVAHLFILFKLHPALTLYEFRMLGWCIHLLAFVSLSIYLYRLSEAPLRSLLIATVPLFVCNIFGLASPSYNSLSSDFLLIALSLWGLAAIDQSGWKKALSVASGLALFIATMAHPALGLVAAIILARELLKHDLAQNLWRGKLTLSNAGMLVFVTCWLAILIYVIGSGAHVDWIRRTALFRSLTVNPLHSNPTTIVGRLAIYPFTYSPTAAIFSLAALVAASALHVFSRAKRFEPAGSAAATLAFLLIVLLICTFSFELQFLSTCFVMASLLLIATHCLRPVASPVPMNSEVRFLMAMSGIAAVLFATTSFYFYPHRSWLSGTLGLPFAFAVGLTLLLLPQPGRSTALLRALTTGALALAVVSVGSEHYRFIYRDSPPGHLVATFRVPKFRHIHSTHERTQVIDTLYDHLHPKIARGESLLAFDDCPMLYYLFDARPAYGLTWATRFTQNLTSLQELDREFKAKPLPNYAIRALIDPSHTVWRTAPRTNYDNYPLNETLLASYELERTIFPFEVWRLKTAAR